MFKVSIRLYSPIDVLRRKPVKLLLLGAPGVGKGTYASRLTADAGWEHISTGNLLRHEVAEKTEIGKAAQSYMDKGDLVPSSIVDSMVKARLLKLEKEGKGFVLDGYPRNREQANTIDSYIQMDVVINLHQPFDVILAKISGRRSCSECGYGYNTSTVNMGGITMEPLLPKKEGICDSCGKPMTLLQRDDDKIEVVQHRLDVYKEVTQPIEDFHKEILHHFDVLGSTKVYYPKFLEFLKDKVAHL